MTKRFDLAASEIYAAVKSIIAAFSSSIGTLLAEWAIDVCNCA